jgi:OOP family OmpA-OmpF porin
MMKLAPTVAIGVTALLATAVLTGCGNSGHNGSPPSSGAMPACLVPQRPVALAIGVRSNNPMPYLPTSIGNLVDTAISAHQTVTFVRLDGNPAVVFSQAFGPQGSNTETRQVEYNDYIDNVREILAGTSQPATDIRAQTGQANVLGALAVAAGEVPAGGDVVVIDSGLQTVEPLNFADDLLSADPQTIVDYLRRGSELPDLSGKHVYFFGLGWTAPPQPSLGINYRKKISQIWTEIADAAGASCVAIDPTPNTQAAVPGLPAVSIVTPPPPPPPLVPCATVTLDDANHLGFEFNSTTFRDPAGARATLRKLANLMLDTDESVTLTGSTSSEGSAQHNQVLSLQRAQEVKSVLVQLGVPGSRITTIGDGAHLPGRLNDRGPNGQLLIGPAIKDRKVVAKLRGKKCRSG